MNAYELADKLEWHWDNDCRSPAISKSIDMLRQQADRITELERLVSDMIYEKASGVYGRPQANPEPQKVTLYIYNNTVDGKTWVDEHPNKMLYPEWKYMGKIEVMK
jgi:hypothetical protein